MTIERTEEEVIIRLRASIDTIELQKLVDYLAYKEATSQSEATQEQVDERAIEVKKDWWQKNRSRLIE